MAAGRFSRRHLLAGLVSAGLLSGCGFKLRGMGGAQADYQSVYLRFDTAVPFDLRQALSQTYQRAGVLIVEDAGLAELVVELGSFERTISRTARSASGQTTAELIRLAQYVSATRMRDEQSILDTQIVVMRDRQLDPNQLMAAERELQSMTREMLLNLAGQIFDRINRAYRAQA